MTICRSVFCFFLLLFIFSCQKEADPNDDVAEDCKLVRMVQGLHDGQADDTTFLFEYDANDRLSQVSWGGSHGMLSWNLVYDGQGHLVRTQSTIQAGFLETIFRYDNNGRLSEIHFDRSDSVKYIFEYDGTGVVPNRCQHWYINFSSGQWVHYTTSIYTIRDGNIVKEEVYKGNTLQWTTEYEYYNDIPNKLGDLPLISINTIPLGWYDIFYFFNKNMPNSVMDETNIDYNITYAIDSGRIASSVGAYLISNTTDTSMKDNRFFYYECK